MSSQWEVVGKPTKKAKAAPSKQLTKNEKKAFIEKMYQRDPTQRNQDNKNTYGAFMETESPREPNGHGNATSTTQVQRKPNKPKKVAENGNSNKAQPPKTLEKALSLIEVKDVESLLVKDQSTFPDNALLWLKDLVSYLNIKLDSVPEPDPVFEKQPANYPLSQVQKSLVQVFRKVMSSASSGVLELFFDHCITSMINDMGKGVSTYGYRIVIQILAHDNPQIIHQHLSQFLELIKTNQNRPLRCLSVMWAVGQCGVKSLSTGLRIWIDIMFPLLAIRALSTYAVTYIENLLSWHKETKSAFGTISFRDFFPIFDVIYTGSGSLPSPLQKRLLAVYPGLKKIAFTNKQECLLRTFFPSFLARLSPHTAEPMRSELRACLVTCLAKDKHCFSLWRQMYTRHFPQSGYLLNSLADDFNRNLPVDKKLLLDTVKTFNVTNEDLTAQGKTNYDGFDSCQAACGRLLSHGKKWDVPWLLWLVLSLGLVAGLVVYDVWYLNRGRYLTSRTHQLMEQGGVYTVSSRVRQYALTGWRWAEVNVPKYYATSVEVVGPYLIVASNKLKVMYAYLVEVSAPLVTWLNTWCVFLITWLQEHVPIWWAELVRVLGPVWAGLKAYSLLLWEVLVRYASMAWAWLTTNVLTGQLSPENLLKHATQTLLVLRHYLTAAIAWTADKIHAYTS